MLLASRRRVGYNTFMLLVCLLAACLPSHARRNAPDPARASSTGLMQASCTNASAAPPDLLRPGRLHPCSSAAYGKSQTARLIIR